MERASIENLARIFGDGASLETADLVRRARDELGSVPLLLPQLAAYRRSVDGELHELVQSRYSDLLALREANRAQADLLLDAQSQLAALREAVASAQRTMATERDLVNARLEAARTVASKERILRRCLEATRLLNKATSLLEATPPNTDACSHASRVAATVTQLLAWSEEGKSWAFMKVLQPRIQGLAVRLHGQLSSLTALALRARDHSQLRTLWGAYIALKATSEVESVVEKERVAGWVRAAVLDVRSLLSLSHLF